MLMRFINGSTRMRNTLKLMKWIQKRKLLKTGVKCQICHQNMKPNRRNGVDHYASYERWHANVLINLKWCSTQSVYKPEKYIVVYFYFVRQGHKLFVTYFGSHNYTFWLRSTKRQPTVSKSFETTIFKHQISFIIIKIVSFMLGS